MEELIRCELSHLAPLAGMLSRAFLHDPLYEYAFPDPGTRAPLARWDFGSLVHYGIRYGEVYAPPALDGCSVWLPPGETDFTEERMAEIGMLDAASQIGRQPAEILDRFVVETEVYHRHLVPDPHWYLLLLGVDPPRQGQGLGRRLLDKVLPRVDASGYPVYLETTNPSNVPFYGKRGFEVRAQNPLSQGGPMVWYMVRPPGTQVAHSGNSQ